MYRVEDTDRRVRNMQQALDQWHTRAADVHNLADKVWDAGDEVAALVKRTKPRLAAIKDTYLKCRLVLEVGKTLVNNIIFYYSGNR